MTTETFTPLEPGSLARVVKGHEDLSSGRHLYKGLIFEVESYTSAEESEEDDGKAYYWGNERGVGDICADASKVVQEMSSEQARARTVPSMKDVRLLVADALISQEGHGVSLIDETDATGGGADVEAYGMLDNGLRVAITVRVVSIEQVDF